ncbi:hypothetical protein ACLB2K_046484 [Fragaria x ananassa]
MVGRLAEALAFTEDEVVDFGDVGMAVEKELHYLVSRMLPPREANAWGLPRTLASLWSLGDQISISQAGDHFILPFDLRKSATVSSHGPLVPQWNDFDAQRV